LQGDRPFSVAFRSGGCARAHPPGVAPEASEEWFDSFRGLNAFRDASAGLVVPSCELVVARVRSQVPCSRAGMLTLSTVWPEPGLREQPPSLRTEREDGQGLTRLFFSYAPALPFRKEEGGGKAPCCPRRGAEHGVSSELLTGDPSGRSCPVR
jgi:hypothetical protein